MLSDFFGGGEEHHEGPTTCVMMIPHTAPLSSPLSQADSHPALIPWELVQRVILCSALLLGDAWPQGTPGPGPCLLPLLWPLLACV